MGMYTEAVLRFRFVGESEPLSLLTGYFDGETVKSPLLERLATLWGIDCDSAYFPGPTCKAKDRNRFTLCFNLKNYESEIEAFLAWIAPHVEEGFIGYMRYEEEVNPTLLYVRDGAIQERDAGSASLPG